MTTVRSRISRLEERHLASVAMIEALDRLIETRLADSAEAIKKADIATDKRFESVNEFRSQLADQAARFITRESVDLVVQRVETVTNNNRKAIEEMAERVRTELAEVRSQGTRLLFALLSTIVGTLVAALVVVWTSHF